MIYTYYLEIKNRFLVLLFSWISTSFVGYIYKETLLFLFIKPGLVNRFDSTVSYFIYTNITDNYYSYLQLIFFISNHVFVLYFFYHVFIFMSPGLYRSECKFFKVIFKAELMLILFSIVFINDLILPASLNFFLGFQSLNIYFEATLREYLNFYMLLYDSCIINFQIFIISAVLLNRVVLSDFGRIKNFRKFFYLLFVTFATLVTPPDIISQIVLSFFAALIFEVSVFYYIFKNRTHNIFNKATH